MYSANDSLSTKVKFFLENHPNYRESDIHKFCLELLNLEPSIELKFLCFYSENEAKKLGAKIEHLNLELRQIEQLAPELLQKINKVFEKVLASANRPLDNPASTDCYKTTQEKLAVKMSSFFKQMITSMENNNNPTLLERLEYIAILASTIGGLAFEKPLVALLSKLIDRTLTFYNLPHGVAVEIPFKLSGHPTNESILLNSDSGVQLYDSLFMHAPKDESNALLSKDNKEHNVEIRTDESASQKELLSTQKIRVSNRIWYPDPLTSFAIAGYLKKASQKPSQKQETIKNEQHLVLTARKVISSLKLKFKKFSGSTSPSSRDFFNACFLAGLKVGKNGHIPYFLSHYAKGKLPSASQSLQSLASIQMKRFAQADVACIHTRQWDESDLLSSSTDNINNEGVLHDIKQACISENYTVLNGEIMEPLQTRHMTVRRLRYILEHTKINVQTELLLKWLIFNLENNKWEYGKGTASRYLSAIGGAWLEYWVNKDIFEYDPDEMQEAFEYICWQQRLTHGSAPVPLGLLFDFIGKEYSSLNVPDPIAEGRSYHHVRSDFITEHHFQQLRFDMQSLYRKDPDYFKLSVDLLLIVIRRTFLRPIEAYSLRLDDIYVSDEIYLKYRRNEYAGYKTASAKRNINLSLFLKSDEIEILMKYLRWRHRVTGGNHRALLFSQSTTHEKMFDRKTINVPSIDFLSGYAGRRIAFYSLRHTGISAMQIVLNADEDFARIVSGYDVNQIKKLKSQLQTGNLGSNFQLSALAGHLSAVTTITIYSHFTDYLLYKALSSRQWRVSKKLLVNLLGERSKYISALSSSKTAELFDEKTVEASRVVNKKYSIKPIRNNAFKSSSLKISHKKIYLAPVDCETVLTLYDAQKSLYEIRELTNVPKWLTSKIIKAANLIKHDPNFMTRREKSRLFENGSRNLCPTKPVHSDELEDLANILKLFSRKRLKGSKHLGSIIWRVLSSCTNTRSEIFFKNPADLKIFLQFFERIVEFDRWSAEFNFTCKIRYRWESIISDIKRNEIQTKERLDKNNKNGNCIVRLARAEDYKTWDKADVEVTLPSTNALKAACHLFAIFVKTYELCQSDTQLKKLAALEPVWGAIDDFLDN